MAQSIRIEILHMGARDQLQEKRISEKFQEHRQQLEAEIQFSSLLPYLQKQQVVSSEESMRLTEVKPERRNRELLDVLVKKGPQFLVRLVECLETSPENKKLAALFAPSLRTGTSVIESCIVLSYRLNTKEGRGLVHKNYASDIIMVQP